MIDNEKCLSCINESAGDFPEEFLDKISKLGLFDWRDALPRNINAIIQSNS